MLDKNVFEEGIKELKIFFPNWKIDHNDSKIVSEWYEDFKEIDNKQFEDGVQRFIDTSYFCPTVIFLKRIISNEKIKDVEYVGRYREDEWEDNLEWKARRLDFIWRYASKYPKEYVESGMNDEKHDFYPYDEIISAAYNM